jgi:hypothetical protein
MTPGQRFAATLILAALAQSAAAQELEPRRWSHLPTGINFAAVGYAYTQGNIFLDPAVLVEDAEAEVHTAPVGYVRTFGLLGRSARVDLVAPFSNGYWEGTIDGAFASTRRQGFGDPKVRFALNLTGSPAQSPAEFEPQPANTIIGTALEVTLPLGEYFKDRLVNLGSNRWVLRPQLGIVHTRGVWAFEATASAWFYSDNDDYQAPGRTLEQDPLYAMQLHLIRTFRPGLWASVSAAYGTGARAIVQGVRNPNEQSNVLWAASVGIPIDRRQGIKLALQAGRKTGDTGVDYERFILAYSLMWGGS